MGLKMHTFRTVLDGAFFPTDLFDRFKRGEFAREFERRKLELLIGEVRDEVSSTFALFRSSVLILGAVFVVLQETIYRQTNPPDSLETLHLQVSNYYPSHVTDKLIDAYLTRKVHIPYAHPDPDPNIDAWKKVYGDISTSPCVHLLVLLHSSFQSFQRTRFRRRELTRPPTYSSLRRPSTRSLPPSHRPATQRQRPALARSPVSHLLPPLFHGSRRTRNTRCRTRIRQTYLELLDHAWAYGRGGEGDESVDR